MGWQLGWCSVVISPGWDTIDIVYVCDEVSNGIIEDTVNITVIIVKCYGNERYGNERYGNEKTRNHC